MKAPSFDYVKVQSLPELLGVLVERGDDAKIIAGGQSLVPTLNMRLSAPEILIDINGLEELKGIAVADGYLRIGALTRHYELGRSDEVAAHAPLLAQALPHIAHEAIRSRGTFGGSIANADPAAELPACLLALRGRLVIAGQNGERTVDVADFFHGLYETAIEPEEVLVAAEIPVLGGGERAAFDELVMRHGDYAIVGLAAMAKADGETLSDVRLSFFSVEDKPVLAVAAAAAVNGKPLNEEVIQAAQAALENDLDPLSDLYNTAATKLHLARVLTGRVLSKLASGGA